MPAISSYIIDLQRDITLVKHPNDIFLQGQRFTVSAEPSVNVNLYNSELSFCSLFL